MDLACRQTQRGVHHGDNRETFYTKGEECSITEIRFQRGQVECSGVRSCSTLKSGGAEFSTIFGSPQKCHAVRRWDFYLLNIYLKVKSGSTSPPCWNQPVLVSLMYTLSPHPKGTTCTERVECKQASDQIPSPCPCLWLIIYLL